MPFTLGSLTLLNPKSFQRSFIETAQTNQTIQNKTTRRVVNRKEVFTLVFSNLTTAQIDQILSIYNLEEVVNFTVNETNLSIGPTPVLIDLGDRDYPKTGKEYRANMRIILKEVI